MYACPSDRRESDRETATAIIPLACFTQRDACTIDSKACYVISIYWRSQEFKVFCGTRVGSMQSGAANLHLLSQAITETFNRMLQNSSELRK